MGQALYRKYRSKRLSEIVGQEHITAALDNALKGGRVSHAYLFTGPRGVGKTSIARILAHEINGLPYNDESIHLDIIEIDAASNRRIDEIRDLRDKVHISPTSAKYKVYIIDEVHMLTKEAFNALLKTLEEPPAHVVFILATTEMHKLPETIVSRTQRYSFKPVPKEQVIEHLRFIAEAEDIAIDAEALGLLAEHGGGSFRDSISLLDQAGNTTSAVTLDTVRAMLGIAPEAAIEQLITSLSEGSPAQLADQLQALHEQGITAASIAKQLSRALRTSLLDGKLTLPGQQAMDIIEKLLGVAGSSDPETLLEVILFGAILPQTSSRQAAPKPATAAVAAATIQAPAPPKATPVKPTPAPISPPTVTKPAGEEAALTAVPVTDINELTQCWPQVLSEIKSSQNTLYGVLRLAQPSWQGSELTLTCKFAFHQKRLTDSKNSRVIADTIKRLTGHNVSLTCIVNDAVTHEPAPNAPEPPAANSFESDKPATDEVALSNLKNVFGGIEVLES